MIYDTQSDNTRYQEFMRRVLQRDKVDVVFAGFSTASREAYRPIVNQFNGSPSTTTSTRAASATPT